MLEKLVFAGVIRLLDEVMILPETRFRHSFLFVKVPRPGDSEVTFSVFRVKLPSVTVSLTTQGRGYIRFGGNGRGRG